MIDEERRDAAWTTALPRSLLALWAVVAAQLLGAGLLGADLLRDGGCGGSGGGAVWLAALATWLGGLGLAWAAAAAAVPQGGAGWGWPLGSLATSAVAARVAAARAPLPRMQPGLNAVWCMVARWASLPPGWRVETGYRGAVAESDEECGGQKASGSGTTGQSAVASAWVVEDDGGGGVCAAALVGDGGAIPRARPLY